MKLITLITGSFFGLTSIVLGAFGAHLFKKIISLEKLTSFETGVKYQIYHAIVLIVLGLMLDFTSQIEKNISIFFILGVIFFSGSIYFLSFQEYWKINLSFLGPITPIGGLFMIIAWGMLGYYFYKIYG